MTDDRHRYRPRRLDEIEDHGVCLINEPLAPANVTALAPRSARPIHAVLVEAVTNTGVRVPQAGHEARVVSAKRYRAAWSLTGWNDAADKGERNITR